MTKAATLAFIAVLLSVFACKQKDQHQNTAVQQADPGSETKTNSENQQNASGHFDISKISITTQNIGAFPYFSAPEGYKYIDEKTKKYEQKYFFYNDSLVAKIAGQYYHTQIASAESGSFEDTYIVNNYKQAIEKLGGVEIYSGGIPDKARDLIDKEKPSYVNDMYDPKPYQYKQFVIRTADQNIWVELCHRLNATLIDLTVIKEETLKGSVGIIQAEEIKH